MTEKMLVDFDRPIREMFKRNISLCRYAEQRNYDLARRVSFPYRRCPEFCHGEFSGISILRELLTTEQSFENPLFHLLFRAFAYGEYRFVKTFIPQNSHEERLTGHLISELVSALTIAESAFQKQSEQMYGEASRLEFHYADMSANLMERKTGADFALILHVNLPDRPESTRVAVCQAKKLYRNKDSVDIDVVQLENLFAWAKDAAYYGLC